MAPVVNLSMSLGRAKGVKSMKKVFFPALVVVKGAVPVSDKKIDRNYETRISVTKHPIKVSINVCSVYFHSVTTLGIINERKIVETKTGANFRFHFLREK